MIQLNYETSSCFGRLAKIVSGTNTVTYHYNDKNQLARRVSNAIPTFYSYTASGRLKTKTLSEPAIAKLEYFYAKDGQIAAREVNGKRQEYKYDLKGQLLEVVGAEKYVYDPAGNILEKTVNGVKTTFEYDKANQLASSMTDGKTKKYVYDAAGRLVKEDDRNYTYVGLDKVASITEGDKMTHAYNYYIDGQLAGARHGDKAESFLWDGLALIARNTSKYVNEPAVTGGNPILADGKVLFNDMLGSTLGHMDGANIDFIDRTAFGTSSGDDNIDFFTGKPKVEGLGHPFLFRNYRSDLGKWQTQDPLGYPDGWNNFAYGNNRVVDGVDCQGTIWRLVSDNGAPPVLDPVVRYTPAEKLGMYSIRRTEYTTTYVYTLVLIENIYSSDGTMWGQYKTYSLTVTEVSQVQVRNDANPGGIFENSSNPKDRTETKTTTENAYIRTVIMHWE